MDVRLAPMMAGDEAALSEFLAANRWPFHVRRHWTPEQVRTAIARGCFSGANARSFWLEFDGRRAGLTTISDLNDPTPILDLRIGETYRGNGLARRH